MWLSFPQTHQGPHQGYTRFLFFAPHCRRDKHRRFQARLDAGIDHFCTSESPFISSRAWLVGGNSAGNSQQGHNCPYSHPLCRGIYFSLQQAFCSLCRWYLKFFRGNS